MSDTLVPIQMNLLTSFTGEKTFKRQNLQGEENTRKLQRIEMSLTRPGWSYSLAVNTGATKEVDFLSENKIIGSK